MKPHTCTFAFLTHATTEPLSKTQRLEEHRTLTGHGIAEAVLMGSRLRDIIPEFNLVFASPSYRSIATSRFALSNNDDTPEKIIKLARLTPPDGPNGVEAQWSEEALDAMIPHWPKDETEQMNCAMLIVGYLKCMPALVECMLTREAVIKEYDTAPLLAQLASITLCAADALILTITVEEKITSITLVHLQNSLVAEAV